MGFHLYEDTWETSTTTGTGAYALAGAVSGWRAVGAQYANGDTGWFVVYDGTNFEILLATYNSGANTLSRTTIYRSTNSGAAVNWGAGQKNIVVAPLGVVLESLFTPGSTGYPQRTADNTWSYTAASALALSSRNLNAGGLVTGGGDLTADRTFTVTAAAKSDQQAGTSTTLAVTPDHQQDHDSAAKAWVSFTGSNAAIQASYGVASVSRSSTGFYTVTFSTAFANANYCCLLDNESAGGSTGFFSVVQNGSRTTTTVGIESLSFAGASGDPSTVFLTVFGRQ